MNHRKKPIKFRWVRGEVNSAKEHIKLFYGKIPEKSWDEFDLVALLAPADQSTFNVQFVLEKTGKAAEAMTRAVEDELDFYLVNKREPNGWAYAIYHCSTGANLYSMVHWAYYPKGDEGETMRSRIVKKGKELWIFKPEPFPKKRH